MLRLEKAAVVGLILLSGSSLRTQQGPEWVRIREIRIPAQEYVVAARLGPEGGLYITGSASGPTEGVLKTMKLSAAGDSEWAALHERAGVAARSSDIAVGPDGTTYIAGITLHGVRNEPFTTTSPVLLAYDQTGELRWERTPPFDRFGGRLAALPDGGAAVAGRSAAQDIVLARYTAAGDSSWVRTYGGPAGGTDLPADVGTDAEGNIYLTGVGDGEFGSCDDEEDCPAAILTLKYSPDGTLLWEDRQRPDLHGEGNVLRTTSDSLFVAGTLASARYEFGFVVLRYDLDGKLVWSRRLATSSGFDPVHSLAVTARGDVAVAGRQSLAAVSADGEELWVRLTELASLEALAADREGGTVAVGSVLRDDRLDLGITALDAAGSVRWTRTYDGEASGDDAAVAVAVDDAGDIYLAGLSTSPLGTSEFLAQRYSASGELDWSVRRGDLIEAQNNSGELLALAEDGGVVVAGVLARDYATVRYTAEGRVAITGYSQKRLLPRDPDLVTVVYGPEGNELWSRAIDLSPRDIGTAVAIAEEGHVVAAGNSGFIGHRPDTQVVTARYDADGNELWRAAFDDEGSHDIALAVVIGSGGEIWVLAGSRPVEDWRTVILKYSAGGDELWRARLDERLPALGVNRPLHVDGEGHAYLGVTARGPAGEGDFLLAKYDPVGAQLWVQRYGTPDAADDVLAAMARGPQGTILLAGAAESLERGFDFLAVEVTPSGEVGRVLQHAGEGQRDDRVRDAAVGADGSIFLTGSSDRDFVTVKFAASVTPRFLRGNCDGDEGGRLTLADAVVLLQYNFRGGREPPCLAACDADGDDRILGQVTDAVYLLAFLFRGGPAPPEPYPECAAPSLTAEVSCQEPPACPAR